ncbi:hypothetical protein KY336_00840 [Candidatus Woesearchaeota archaeon]|nr:hypothetical protein [Candidatus Woesearchaeota archaeon]
MDIVKILKGKKKGALSLKALMIILVTIFGLIILALLVTNIFQSFK